MKRERYCPIVSANEDLKLEILHGISPAIKYYVTSRCTSPPVPLRPCYIRPERKKTVTRTDLNQHHFPRNIAEEDTLRSYLYHVISIKNRSLRSLLRKTWPSDEHRNPFPSPPLLFFIGERVKHCCIRKLWDVLRKNFHRERESRREFLPRDRSNLEPFLNFKMSAKKLVTSILRKFDKKNDSYSILVT